MQSQQPDSKQTDLDALQALLVGPELKKLRRQVTELQEKVDTLEQKNAHLETQHQQSLTVIHTLIDQKLSSLRQELFEIFPELIDAAIDEQIDPGQTFSIRVAAVEQEA